jgi:Protein of unknown function (DUF2628).
VFCSNCGASLNNQSHFCSSCGTKVASPNAGAMGKEQPDARGQADLTEKLIGKNAAYYISRWARPGQRKGWNWATAFWWFLWLGYRKMYRDLIFVNFAFVLGTTFVELIGRPDLILGLNAGLFVYFGMYGNVYYRNHISKLEQKHLSNPALYPVEKIGGTSVGGIFIALGVGVLGSLISVMITGF